ncbi:MAG: EF-P lysine aminoacylase EpmA [Gammaproteobacteria bacterium]|jgi:lysyl-tRNA synthetase class 2|nr:EF-P lysine aminoacylase EpmA [Gammaproteobacteria bacterium]
MPAAPGQDWRPQADMRALRMRAEVLARIRAFFAARDVLEVETPVLSQHAVTDPHLHSLRSLYSGPGAPAEGLPLYLQTSPEFAMKRLLCAGSGPIYQIARVFRDDERGRLHNIEFTLLEWYRPGFDHHRLMDEVGELVCDVLGVPARWERISYGELFRARLGIDCHAATPAELAACAAAHGVDVAGADSLSRDEWLDLLLTHLLQPALGKERPLFLHDYPASQAALARLYGNPPVAERFELYVQGIELANGYHELGDASEQRRRFEQDNAQRRAAGLSEVAPDERLLAALEHGLPPCAGVALGLDRLLMLAAGVDDIAGVMAFTVERA